jgi:hypothetical protein
MVFATPEGAQTMSKSTPSPFVQLAANNNITQINDYLALVNGDQQERLIQAHQDAENALSMALHYLRSSACNIPGATRKAVQAWSDLNTLQAAGAGRRPQIGGAA